MLSDRLNSIKSRKSFYRDRYDRAVKLLCILLVGIALMLVALVSLSASRVETDYYASKRDGLLVHLEPL